MTNAQKTILVVDDVRVNTILLKQMLAKTAHRVATVASGAEALAFLHNDHADLVLLDLMMPVMNGYEVLSAIRAAEATKELPVVIVSALSGKDDIEAAMQKGANDYLTKPIDEDDLLDAVAKYLG